MYKKLTKSIEVSVTPVFLDEQSDPCNNHYVWAYNIVIENQGSKNIQVKLRDWYITDIAGKTIVLNGESGVDPDAVLGAGDSFQYTSGVPLDSPSAIMHGNYYVINEDGDAFAVPIPVFSLDSPYDFSARH